MMIWSGMRHEADWPIDSLPPRSSERRWQLPVTTMSPLRPMRKVVENTTEKCVTSAPNELGRVHEERLRGQKSPTTGADNGEFGACQIQRLDAERVALEEDFSASWHDGVIANRRHTVVAVRIDPASRDHA